MKYSPSKGKENRVERGRGSVNTLSCREMESFDGIANETGRHRRPILSELAESTKMFFSLTFSSTLLLFSFLSFFFLPADCLDTTSDDKKTEYLEGVFISRSLPERCPIDPLVSIDYTYHRWRISMEKLCSLAPPCDTTRYTCSASFES